MTSFSPFIRKTSPEMRELLSQVLQLPMADEVNWADAGLKFAQEMIELTDRQGSSSILERIAVMSDDIGDVAMDSVSNGTGERPYLAGAQDRAIWLFANDQDTFLRAEEARFMDGSRRTRRWKGFSINSDLEIANTPEARAAFAKALLGTVSDGLVQVDVYERNRCGFDGAKYRVVQITVYAEQKPEVTLEFRDLKVASVARRPVLAAALTYEPQSGVVEVAADAAPVRAALVSAFLKNLISVETPVEALQLRRFDLQHLKRRHAFPTDVEDQIESVALRSLRLMPIAYSDQRLTIEALRKPQKTIWEAAEEHFGAASPLRSGWLVTSAVISVSFRPAGKAKRGKTITLHITEPNGCDLKDRTELEQLIGNKYLRRWGILSDDVDLLEG